MLPEASPPYSSASESWAVESYSARQTRIHFQSLAGPAVIVSPVRKAALHPNTDLGPVGAFAQPHSQTYCRFDTHHQREQLAIRQEVRGANDQRAHGEDGPVIA